MNIYGSPKSGKNKEEEKDGINEISFEKTGD
jgi:hypothetical protein